MPEINNILSFVFGSVWAIESDKFGIILDFLARRNTGDLLSDTEIAAIKRTPMPRTPPSVSSNIGVIPIFGTIFPRAGMVPDISGGTSMDRFVADLTGMANNTSVSSIILHVDSPGGAVSGVTEAANLVRGFRDKKRIVAVAEGSMTSAAYWIGSAAHEIVASPSSIIGSIGVIARHTDKSAMDEKAGLKTTLVTAGGHKGEDFGALTDDAIAHRQAMVDEIYQVFVSDVAKSRGVTVQDVVVGYGQGRVMSATNALKARMIDRIGTLEETIGRLSSESHRKATYKKTFGAT
jgi:signal peptide peptidase SppA